jgi:hypothetical protein
MFSTIDYQQNRSVRIQVLGEANEAIRGDVPAGYERALLRARMLPKDPSGQILADSLARTLWLKAGRAGEASVKKVVVEVHTIVYDPSTHELSTRRLSSFESVARP